MADRTGIEWTDATWNPVTGCTKVSPGCDHCYAETIAHRFDGTAAYPAGFDVTLRPERLNQPLHWKRPRRVFVNSMSDLFHDQIPDDYIAEVWAVMSIAKLHTFQVLTKRPGRMRSLLRSALFRLMVNAHRLQRGVSVLPDSRRPDGTYAWPLPNVWLGVSTEDQRWANVRVPVLLGTPATVRFVSAEPLLGPIDLDDLGGISSLAADWAGGPGGGTGAPHPLLDWVIVGGESGHGARPMHPDWARALRDQCTSAGVAFHFKQWGEWVTEDQSPDDIVLPPTSWKHLGNDEPSVWKVGKRAAGRELDGRTWDEHPSLVSA
ncbi:DUF5131 family protein [Auraticoccus monumenti]|uniref:Protein gp37 n=1 Tax=Auraticoccus monumenti TaxID=675864 RepID=A0A1G6UP65_9ACTN|nr:phage Gp37/Gp68 family protein [Auraticoccus monumenti]SDD42506.1 protein gp37 [Auraticoccus monumenti]